MLFASDHNDNRIFIDDTHSNCEYYCPYCGAPLTIRKGEIKRHHFAHKPNHLCHDSWERSGSYDTSEWHNEWQSRFPKANQEIKLILGETKHRADVMIGRTVVEFQHSIMPSASFDDRNNFYFNLGYKVVWLFDLTDIIEKGKLSYKEANNGLIFSWNNPKKAFNCYDVQSGCIDLFFQLNEGEERSIVRVTDVSEYGFEEFETTQVMDKASFLAYVGLCDGICAEPDRDDLAKNESYQRFKEKYSIVLNKQQERALQAVEGANLLLAVPGSGKTTVLVARLGYMVVEKKIDPSLILAVTYNKDATTEMETRFIRQFGEAYRGKIAFRTLNSLALDIYTSYCRSNHIQRKCLIEEKEHRKLLAEVYRNAHYDEFATEKDILELQTAITYIKNMGLSREAISELDDDIPNLSKMYAAYQARLDEEFWMDFDDQIVFACDILEKNPEYLAEIRQRYRYICVDEAQDTSKMQHRIIELISQGNNLFMVGDEDQSIYGFRAAYPKALLNFRYTYRNPYILRMECNYRSTPQIVEKAQSFISKNKGRYEKKMFADRGDGAPVSLVPVKDRCAQYRHLLDVAQNHTEELAFLYRDNESAVALVDLFLRNNIPFKLRKPEMNFFNTKVVRDIVAYLSLALNRYDVHAFGQLCNKGILYLKGPVIYWTKKKCVDRRIDIYQALDEQMQYVKYQYKDRAKEFRIFMNILENKSSADAIKYICSSGYTSYLQEKGMDTGKIDILLMLAEHEPDKQKFLQRLTYLDQQFMNGFECRVRNPVILSTIHSSKGLEYDTVYMVDTYDGRFPSSRPNIFSRSKDNADGEQEERRLFYVGITRAKNRLFIMQLLDRKSSYISELFPDLNSSKEQDARPALQLPAEITPNNRTSQDVFDEPPGSLNSATNLSKEGTFLIKGFNQDLPRETDKNGISMVRCARCRRVVTTDECAFTATNGMSRGCCIACASGK